jgi:hypothetical protein
MIEGISGNQMLSRKKDGRQTTIAQRMRSVLLSRKKRGLGAGEKRGTAKRMDPTLSGRKKTRGLTGMRT